MIEQLGRHFGASAVIAVAIIAAGIVRADAQTNAYVVTPLVSDQTGKAPIVDPNLKNAWGVAFTPAASPFWIADNATGLATLYEGDGTIVNITGTTPVVIPCPPKAGQGSACPAHHGPFPVRGLHQGLRLYRGQS